ncbi:MAG TPA: excinuclease ABC subunit UvrC [Candidatus Scybalocola faecavium]|nr:excinuclease ABC subunit UvrC [Candidatus Scybalocola faecavium]
MFDLEEELKKLPARPGVYIMHDSHDDIIYVGKAISLKNRVRQYFQSSRNLSPKIASMVPKIARFEYIVTDSELEALVLECNLIKEHRPKYNTMLKDDKTYPYIKVTVNEPYPRIIMTRKMKKDGAKYFGPYTSGQAVRDTIELLRKIYKIRSCNRSLPGEIGKGRPCLYHHMGQCEAPCQDYISKEKYRENISGALSFLSGNYKAVAQMLQDKMQAASEAMAFEKAIEYRDLLNSVHQIVQKQKITSSQMDDRDVIAYAKAGDEAVVQVFFIRGGKLIGRDHFYLTGVENESHSEILTAFVKQFYAGSPFIPGNLLVQDEILEADVITQWLSARRGQKVTITVPKKGQKERLVELAAQNASMVLQKDSEKIKREEARTVGAMRDIANALDIPLIRRIEAFDISNISGYENVGSMIVYEDGKPKKNAYRKFKIKWFKGQDDYQSMEEVLTRRFTHGLKEQQELKEKGMSPAMGSFSAFPDLLMMDGGKGQVNVALRVLDSLHLDIPVCGMVKDDHHNTRGLYYNNVEIPISRTSEMFKLITRIQDEAHRFAIEYHRSLRQKGQVHSVLDDIEGIGPARRKALMRHFKEIEAIQKASVEELAAIDSMNMGAAQKVYDFFH